MAWNFSLFLLDILLEPITLYLSKLIFIPDISAKSVSVWDNSRTWEDFALINRRQSSAKNIWESLGPFLVSWIGFHSQFQTYLLSYDPISPYIARIGKGKVSHPGEGLLLGWTGQVCCHSKWEGHGIWGNIIEDKIHSTQREAKHHKGFP